MAFWGYHTILDVKGCDITKATDPVYIEEFLRTLVKAIDMVPYGEPQIVHFGKNEPHLSGWTAFQMIETSTITFHFCDESGDLYADIFSCKYYDPNEVIEMVEDMFTPERIRVTYLTRQA